MDRNQSYKFLFPKFIFSLMSFDSIAIHPRKVTWRIDQYKFLTLIRVILAGCTSVASHQVGDKGYDNSNKAIVN